eukprot:1176165-Prorocentrum_minimum.AAC.2
MALSYAQVWSLPTCTQCLQPLFSPLFGAPRSEGPGLRRPAGPAGQRRGLGYDLGSEAVSRLGSAMLLGRVNLSAIQPLLTPQHVVPDEITRLTCIRLRSRSRWRSWVLSFKWQSHFQAGVTGPLASVPTTQYTWYAMPAPGRNPVPRLRREEFTTRRVECNACSEEFTTRRVECNACSEEFTARRVECNACSEEFTVGGHPLKPPSIAMKRPEGSRNP